VLLPFSSSNLQQPQQKVSTTSFINKPCSTLTCLQEELLPAVEAMLARVAEVDSKIDAAYHAECDQIAVEL